MQTLKFIGRGSAFNVKEGNTAAYYKNNNYLLLIDCGSNIFERILKNNLLDDIKEIYILITHLHSDHMGSLSDLIYYCYYILGIKPTVFFPTDELDNILKEIGHTNEYDNLERDVIDIHDISFMPIKVSHLDNMNCFGYYLIIEDKDIWYSGDCNEFAPYTEDIHKFDEMYQDTSYKDYEGNVHLSLKKLCEAVPKQYRNKVYCMHIDNDNLIEEAIKEGFNVVTVE